MNNYENTWSNKIGSVSKAIVATVTPAIALGASLGSLLPADQAAYVTAGVSIATGFLTWLTTNTPRIQELGDSAEDLAEDTLGRDV